jgi:eukaryotic-like serine/threonine-protein kinase
MAKNAPALPPDSAEIEKAGRKDLLPGDTLGKYSIEKKLGQGGMGTVYLARDTQLKRLVAVKILPPDKAQNQVLVRRFEAEAQAAARLHHENIVTVYESGQLDDKLYIAMEYVEGVDVHDLILKRGTIPLRRSVEIIKQVASALAHAHQHSIVHRDIKPSNLLIRRDGMVKLTDLGLARSVDDTVETGITRAGTTVGTVDYMAPEQARNSKAADVRSDIYSLGCTWYHMLTGQPPYPKGSLTNKLQSHALSPIPNPRDLNPNVTEAIVGILNRMLAKKVADRYQTPKELLGDLELRSITRGGVANELFRAIAEEDGEDYDSTYEGEDGDDLQSAFPDQSNSEKNTSAGSPAGTRNAKPLPKEKRSPGNRPSGSANDDDDTAQIADEDLESDVSNGKSAKKRGVKEKEKNGARSERDAGDQADAADEKTASQSASRNSRKGNLPPGALPPKKQAILTEADYQAGASEARQRLLRNIGIAAAVIVGFVTIGGLAAKYSTVFDSTGGAAKASPFDPKDEGGPASVNPVEQIEEPKVAANAPQKGQQSSSGTDPKAMSGASATPSGPKPPAIRPDAVPSWIDAALNVDGLVEHRVGSISTGGASFATIADALAKLPQKGGIVRLASSGVYQLPATTLQGKGRVIITCEAKERPVIKLVTDGDGKAGLTAIDSDLTLDGVHLVVDERIASSEQPVSMVKVIGGGLTVRDGSCSIEGESKSVTLFDVEPSRQGNPQSPQRVLLDRIFARAQGADLLRIGTGRCEAVIRNSVLATATGSAVTLRAIQPEFGLGGGDFLHPERSVRFLHSTVSSQEVAIDIEQPLAKPAGPPATTIISTDSIFATPVSRFEPAILRAIDWPKNVDRSVSQGRLNLLNWSSRGTLAAGYRKLVESGPNEPFRVESVSNWFQMWGSPPEQQTDFQITETSWPNLSGPVNQASLELFDRSTLDSKGIATSDGVPPGCDISRLNQPEATQAAWSAIDVLRPVPPGTWLGARSGQPKEIELTQGKDLGLLLQRETAAVSSIMLKGNANRPMSTVTVRQGQTLILYAKPNADGSEFVLSPKSESDRNPLFRVKQGGRLELHGLSLALTSAKPDATRTLIEVEGGELLVQDCKLRGLASDPASLQGLVRLGTQAGGLDATQASTVINDSLLTGNGPLLSLAGDAGHLKVSGSLFVARQDAIALQAVATMEGNAPRVCDITRSTFSAGRGALGLSLGAGIDASSAPRWDLVVEECVFGPAPSVEKSQMVPAVVYWPDRSTLETAYRWHGRLNAIAGELTHWIQPVVVPLGNSPAAEWETVWGKNRELNPATGSDAVLWKADPGPKWGIEQPTKWTLARGSKGATWDGGRPVGANPDEIGKLAPVPAGSIEMADPEGQKSNPKPGAKPANNSNPGF